MITITTLWYPKTHNIIEMSSLKTTTFTATSLTEWFTNIGVKHEECDEISILYELYDEYTKYNKIVPASLEAAVNKGFNNTSFIKWYLSKMSKTSICYVLLDLVKTIVNKLHPNKLKYAIGSFLLDLDWTVNYLFIIDIIADCITRNQIWKIPVIYEAVTENCTYESHKLLTIAMSMYLASKKVITEEDIPYIETILSTFRTVQNINYECILFMQARYHKHYYLSNYIIENYENEIYMSFNIIINTTSSFSYNSISDIGLKDMLDIEDYDFFLIIAGRYDKPSTEFYMGRFLVDIVISDVKNAMDIFTLFYNGSTSNSFCDCLSESIVRDEINVNTLIFNLNVFGDRYGKDKLSYVVVTTLRRCINLDLIDLIEDNEDSIRCTFKELYKFITTMSNPRGHILDCVEDLKCKDIKLIWNNIV